MKYKIDEETLQQTTKCENNFACLSDECPNICGVLRAVGTQLIITSCTDSCAKCAYCVCFNPADPPAISEAFCTCPVRVELFKRHGI
jgi:hypothetical protein